MSSIAEIARGRGSPRVAVAIILIFVAAFVIWKYFRASFEDIGVPALLVALFVMIPLLLLWPLMTNVGVQQMTLFSLLILGLGCYLIGGWRLLSTGAVDSAANVSELQKAGMQLFLPYLGIAIGGVFGVKRLSVTPADRNTFFIAVAVLVLWDALAIGNIWAMAVSASPASVGSTEAAAAAAALLSDEGFADAWAFEDALRFVNDLMPLLSFLPAAAIGFYFGAQPGKPALETETTLVKPAS